MGRGQATGGGGVGWGGGGGGKLVVYYVQFTERFSRLRQRAVGKKKAHRFVVVCFFDDIFVFFFSRSVYFFCVRVGYHVRVFMK